MLSVLLLLTGALVLTRLPDRNAPTTPEVWLTPARYQEPETERAAPKPLPLSTIAVDTARKRSTDTDALRALFSDERVTLPRSETLDIGVPTEETVADWFVWGRLGGAQADVRLELTDRLPQNALGVYASHASEGSAVVLVNRSAHKVPVRVRTRLPRGVYKIERLSFLRPEAEAAPAADDADSAGQPEQGGFVSARPGLKARIVRSQEDTALHSTARLERWQGRDLGAAGLIEKPHTLEPGEVCILRYTEQVRETATAWRETNLQLNALALTNKSAARRMRRMLNEGRLNVNGLYGSRKATASRRLSALHKMLLVTAQAQSVHRNLQTRRVVPADSGANLMGALERLTDALSETSAAMLGLVPRITVEKKIVMTPTPAVWQEPDEAPSNSPSPVPSEVMVTVGLTNGGAQSVRMVKLGMDVATLPAGIRCEPHDPAYFESVRPGQTARATFLLRGPMAANYPPNRCAGDVSYFTTGAPAHLRPRSW